MMSDERNRATIMRFFRDVMGAGELAVLDVLAVEDYADHVALPMQGPGREGLKWRVATIRSAFRPRQQLHDVIVDGDLVAAFWTLSGVHSGYFVGLAPTQKPVEFNGIDLYAMRDGRMAEHWNVVDIWSFYRQAGGPTN